ncbi:MAG: phosphomevalonate kinase, partial [Scardovia wiggsiae]
MGSYKQVCSDDFEEYCRGVARCADIFARCCAGLRTADIQHALAAISDASQLMHGLSDAVEKYYYNGDDSAGLSGAQETSMKIETDTLKELIDIAERYGLAGKVSGAGGGDCGIAAGQILHGIL